MNSKGLFETPERFDPRPAALVGVLVALTYVNDVVFLLTETYTEWLVADHAFRVATLAVVMASPSLRRACLAFLNWPQPGGLVIVVAAVLVFLGIVIDASIVETAEDLFGETNLFVYPKADSGVLEAVDLTAGLALVAASEEAVFRALLPLALLPHLRSAVGVTLVTAVLFGAMHWSGGVGQCAVATVIGALFMASVFRTGTIWPALIAHYLINLYWFL